MHYHISSRLRVFALSATTVFALSGSLVTPVYAQGDNVLEEVTVTGSRIVRKDYVSNSPIVTVDAAAFEQQSGLNVESYLNQLPQYNPATTPVTTQQDVQITPVNSVGIASISLRGFGPNRSLVLVDGKRPVPINALMVTDVNSIPSSMIQRVETITGGASAVYGADAVGGVTNFILRNNFEGMEFDGQFGTNEAGDGDEYRVSAVLGSNFSDGRGNITVGMEYYNRETSYYKNRDFYTDAWTNPNQGGNFIGFIQGVNGYNCAFNCPPAAVANALFPDKPAGSTITNPDNYFIGNIGLVSTFYFNPDGSIFVNGSAAGFSKFQNSGIYAQSPKYTLQNVYDNSVPSYTGGAINPAAPQETQQLKYNFPNGYAQGPQERYSFMISGHYNITDRLRFTSHANFEQSTTRTLLAGNSAIFGWEADIPYDPTTDSPLDPTLTYDAALAAAYAADPAGFLAANPNPGFIPHGAAGAQHPVPPELAILLNSRPDFSFIGGPFANGGPTGPWIPQWNTDKAFLRNTSNTNTVWQVDAALNMDLPFRDWTGELYFSHGESTTYNINTGNMSLARYRALAAQPDYGAGATLQGNDSFLIPGNPPTVGTAASTNFGAAVPVTCTSGFYDTFFSGEQRPSEDCIDAINATLQSSTHNSQDIIEVNLQGGVMDLPAGEMRGAVGFQYRRNSSLFTPDILQSVVSFTDQVVGVYPTGYLNDQTTPFTDYTEGAYTDAKDVYAELLIPIVSDLPYMRKLELETGARHSNYNQAPNTWTYKFLANWEVNDWLRLRGGYNRASRAPNLGELYLNRQEIFTIGGVNFGDPCGYISNAPWGASGAVNEPAGGPNPGVPGPIAGGQTAAGAQSTYMICQAMMGAAAATYFYSQAGSTGNTASAFNWVQQQGNANLTSEDADTYTAGFVASSPLSNPWLAGLQGTMDWYQVDINNAIQPYSVDYANYLCFGTNIVTTPAEAAAQAASEACSFVPRNQSTGGALTSTLSYDNLATISTSGFDFGVNWHANLEDLGFSLPGSLNASVQANYLLYYETKASPLYFDVTTDWAGSLGPNLSGTNPGAYEYRIFSAFTYAQNNWSVTLRWRHLPSVVTAGVASQNAVIDYDASAPANQLLSYTPTTAIEVDSYDILDLAFSWDINDVWSLRGGINNVADFDPAITGATAGYPGGTNLEGVCGNAPGCQNPNAYSLPSPGAGITSAGFYDTLGRRFFVGLKARF